MKFKGRKKKKRKNGQWFAHFISKDPRLPANDSLTMGSWASKPTAYILYRIECTNKNCEMFVFIIYRGISQRNGML